MVSQLPPSKKTGPGDTQFTRMPFGARLCDRFEAKAIIAAFIGPNEPGPANSSKVA